MWCASPSWQDGRARIPPRRPKDETMSRRATGVDRSRKGTHLHLAAGARTGSPFAPVEEAIEAFRRGDMVIIVDDEDRENEGDLALAADKVTPRAINFMATHGRGLVCLAMTGQRLDELEIPLMVTQNSSRFETAFCVSIEAKGRTSTGISAADRAATVQMAIEPGAKPEDLARPGHMFPLRAREGGVLVRAGQTEASVDLARIAGLYPAAVICEIMNPDGTMARVTQLARFARRHGLLMITIADLIRYRMRTEGLVRQVAVARLPTEFGEFQVFAFESVINQETHVALVRGELDDGKGIMVRVHSKCLTGDVFHSSRCDCGPQLHKAMQRIAEEGQGVLLYLNQEGRGIGLANKIRAYELQDQGYDTVEANERLGFKADQRDYGIGAQILRHLGVRSMRLLTNNPRKFVGLEGYGLSVVESLPLEIPASEHTRRYLRAKKEKLGHKLNGV
jgi:3,4-dihydroxy 2-butanone 4-phosphate synthase/GTP cyclohydrolase II